MKHGEPRDQLRKSPAVQPRAHAPTRADAIADVREVLHHDLGSPMPWASLMMALLVSWLMCLTRRRSLPETCRSACRALWLPLDCRRRRWARYRSRRWPQLLPTQIADIRLKAHPESFQINRLSQRMYVNVSDADEQVGHHVLIVFRHPPVFDGVDNRLKVNRAILWHRITNVSL